MEQIACTLDDGQMSERRRRWHELAGRAFVERTETPEGLRLVFRADDGVEAELRELADLERTCCAFASWSVSGSVLDVTAESEEAVAAVHGMFRSLASGA
jgi:hypothetical protein